MKETSINVSTKKDEVQLLRFGIFQENPYPDIEGHSGAFRWRNHGGLFREFGNAAKGLAAKYGCYLLAPGVEVPTTGFGAKYLAGLDGNGGTLKVRGKDLGEMDIHFEGNDGWPTIRVRGTEAPSDGERDVIMRQVVPLLREFIEANKAELRDEAIARVKAKFAERIAEMRKQVDKLEIEAAAATY